MDIPVSDAEVALLIEAEVQSGKPIEAKAVAGKKVSRLRGRESGKRAKGTFFNIDMRRALTLNPRPTRARVKSAGSELGAVLNIHKKARRNDP